MGGLGVKSVCTGSDHTCAINNEDTVYCWGYNGSGQLGNNTTTQSKIPTLIYDNGELSGTLGGLDAISISVGYEYSCAINSDINFIAGVQTPMVNLEMEQQQKV